MAKGRSQEREVNKLNALTGYSFKAARSKPGPRLYPVNPACTTKTCKAHSIQNSTVLDFLAEQGHLIVLRTRRVDSGRLLRAEFKRVGRNNATTFEGLCAEHDTKLFAPIDNRPLDLEDREQLFLLAYRSVLRQAHAIPTGASLVEAVSERARHLGLRGLKKNDALGRPIPRLRDGIKPIGVEKDAWDRAYLCGGFDDVDHEIAWTAPSQPSLAVSFFFSIGCNSRNYRQLPVALNVFPHDGRHAIILSYRKPSKPLAQNLIFALKRTSSEERFRAQSPLVLKNCENFVLRPSLYHSFGQEQEQLIRDYFLRTVGISTLGGREVQPVSGLVKDDDVEKLNLVKVVAPRPAR
jgi:hypothetical protein